MILFKLFYNSTCTKQTLSFWILTTMIKAMFLSYLTLAFGNITTLSVNHSILASGAYIVFGCFLCIFFLPIFVYLLGINCLCFVRNNSMYYWWHNSDTNIGFTAYASGTRVPVNRWLLLLDIWHTANLSHKNSAACWFNSYCILF